MQFQIKVDVGTFRQVNFMFYASEGERRLGFIFNFLTLPWYYSEGCAVPLSD